MGKALKTVGVIIGGAALIATGVGAFAMPALAGSTTLFGVSVGTLNTISSGLIAVGGLLDKPKSQGSASPDEWTSNPDQPVPFLMGRMGIAGKIVQRDEFGPDNMYQGIVGILSGAGPIRGVTGFSGDKQPVTFGANGIAVSSQWQGEMWMVRRSGAQPDTALTVPAGLKSGGSAFEWSPAARLSGKACYLQVLGENSKGTAFPAGVPDPMHTAEGIYGYDPRYDDTYPGGAGPCRLGVRSTYRWIEDGGIGGLNWALGLVENGQVVGGIGASIDGIDVPAFVEVANVADANGWKLAAWPDTSEDVSAVLDQLLQAAGAVRARHAGKISCVSRGAPRASVATITARDTAGDIELDTAPSLFNRLNTITPRFMSEAAGWVLTPANPVSFAQYVTDDGGKHSDQIDYRFVSSLKQAAELAAYDILDAREPFSGTIPLKAHMRHLKRGDTFLVSEPGFLMDGVKCIVLSRSYDPKTAQVRIGFRSETDSKHALALGKATTLPDFPVLTPTDPTYVTAPLPGDWVITPRPPAPGGQLPGFDLGGIVSNDTATSIIVEHGPTDGGPWKQAYEGPPTVTNIPIDGLQPGATYYIAIQYRRDNNYSARHVYGPYVAPDLIATDVSPTAPTIVAMQDAIDLAEGGIGSINTAVASLNATIYTAGTGLQSRSDAMFASLNTPTTGVLARLTATESAVSTNNAAAVDRLNALEATVNTAGTGLTARLATAESAITANNNAATSRLTALEATVNTAGTGLSARVAGLQTAVSDLNTGKANASDLIVLQTEVTTARGGAASLNTRLNTVESNVAGKASATSVSALEAAVNTAGTGLLARAGAAEAAIVDLQGQKADASRVAVLEAKAGGFNKQRNPRWLNGWDAWPIRIGNWSYSTLSGGDVSWALFGPAAAGETALLYGEMIPWGENQPIGLSGRRYANGITSGVLQIYIGCYDAAGGSTGPRQNVTFFNGGYPAGQAEGAQTFLGQTGQVTPPGTTQVRIQIEAVGVSAGAYFGLYYDMLSDDPRRAFSDDATAQSAYSRVASLETATSDLQGGKADASRVTSLEAIVNTPGTGVTARLTNVESVAASADGTAKSIKGFVQDVNGYVSGFSSVNNGLVAQVEFLADSFGIRSPGSGERTEYRSGRWYIYSPAEATRTMYGKAFGGDQKLVWWIGPSSVAEGSETKGNAYVYMSQNTVGGPRFGGSDVLGPGGTLTATASTGFIGGARNGAGYVATSNQVTVTVSGGTAGATIRWTRISGDSRIQMNNASAFVTGGGATIGIGEVISAYFMGAVTKGGQSAVVYVQVDLSDNGT